jgi:hypothetical protein
MMMIMTMMNHDRDTRWARRPGHRAPCGTPRPPGPAARANNSPSQHRAAGPGNCAVRPAAAAAYRVERQSRCRRRPVLSRAGRPLRLPVRRHYQDNNHDKGSLTVSELHAWQLDTAETQSGGAPWPACAARLTVSGRAASATLSDCLGPGPDLQDHEIKTAHSESDSEYAVFDIIIDFNKSRS